MASQEHPQSHNFFPSDFPHVPEQYQYGTLPQHGPSPDSDHSYSSPSEYEVVNGGLIKDETIVTGGMVNHVPHMTTTVAYPTTTHYIPVSAPMFTAGRDWESSDHLSPSTTTPDMVDSATGFGAPVLFPDNWGVAQMSFPPAHFAPNGYVPTTRLLYPSVSSGSSERHSHTRSSPSHNSTLDVPAAAPTRASTTLALSAAQQAQLASIAMPAHVGHQPALEHRSSRAESGELSPTQTSETSKPTNKKRKSMSDDDQEEDEDDDGAHPVKKTAHNMIEKRYRTNLNVKIAALRDSVPSLRIMSKSVKGEDTTEDREELHGLTPAHKLNKATVLSKATEYIRHLEKRTSRLRDENSAMQQRLSAFEQLYRAGALSTSQQGFDLNQPLASPPHIPRSLETHGIPYAVDDKRRPIHAQMMVGQPYAVPGQQMQQHGSIVRHRQVQQQPQQGQGGGWHGPGPFVGKLMVGALGGLMVVEAIRENEQSNDSTTGRGLFAVPIQLLSPFLAGSHYGVGILTVPAVQLISTLKALLILGVLLWVFVPSIFAPSFSKMSKSAANKILLRPAPSLASPIHVRRQAWLTAIQTVWVPRHNFVLELSAVLLKILKVSIRNLVGVHGYQMITGLTEEQETARVKAWTIALDAQLAGGDVEINHARLLLTYFASKTLPSTSLRRMMDTLHIHVIDQRNSVTWRFASTVARMKWKKAKELQILTQQQLQDPNDTSTQEDLPSHLAVLLEQDCDDVMNTIVVQRAINLALNKPTTSQIDINVDGMDAVVDDPAVRSPMDAVAAWWSSYALQRVLSQWLAINSSDKTIKDPAVKAAVAAQLETAIKVSPIGSNAQGRALVAKALLIDEKRGASIASALQALDPSINPDKHPSYANGVPPLIDAPHSTIAPDLDVQMALRCTMTIAQLQRFEVPDLKALAVVDGILQESQSEHGMSLLGFTAAFQLMDRLHAHPYASKTCAASLERLAGTLRIWVGSSEGERPGLDKALRQKMVAKCLVVTKSVVGIHEDEGYGTMSEATSESGKCSFD